MTDDSDIGKAADALESLCNSLEFTQEQRFEILEHDYTGGVRPAVTEIRAAASEYGSVVYRSRSHQYRCPIDEY